MNKNINIKTKSFEEVLKKLSKSPSFKSAYNEEITRLRLASDIRKLRTDRKLTQADVAKKADMPQSIIARIEGGKHSISMGTLGRVAHALGKEVRLS